MIIFNKDYSEFYFNKSLKFLELTEKHIFIKKIVFSKLKDVFKKFNYITSIKTWIVTVILYTFDQ